MSHGSHIMLTAMRYWFAAISKTLGTRARLHGRSTSPKAPKSAMSGTCLRPCVTCWLAILERQPMAYEAQLCPSASCVKQSKSPQSPVSQAPENSTFSQISIKLQKSPKSPWRRTPIKTTKSRAGCPSATHPWWIATMATHCI